MNGDSNETTKSNQIARLLRRLIITTKVTYLNTGLPASQVLVNLFRFDIITSDWVFIKNSITGVDGTCTDLTENVTRFLDRGLYKILYNMNRDSERLYESMPLFGIIEVVFNAAHYGHYDIKILASHSGYVAYRSM
ncbi:PREDICTED: 5-hydroxyisourate hydrolase-like [Dinoponera quadriceps]|uniref:5-hydroxyisourate hydrolase-like n=1 Tax=Dinoponera quadriceps TaxID=609295 RepID=A0A6P3XZN5_DINQU|nr:PREDICTED: 5-hydroxyisourate hydrolase-like [Dinoponera quadriceps]